MFLEDFQIRERSRGEGFVQIIDDKPQLVELPGYQAFFSSVEKDNVLFRALPQMQGQDSLAVGGVKWLPGRYRLPNSDQYRPAQFLDREVTDLPADTLDPLLLQKPGQFRVGGSHEGRSVIIQFSTYGFGQGLGKTETMPLELVNPEHFLCPTQIRPGRTLGYDG